MNMKMLKGKEVRAHKAVCIQELKEAANPKISVEDAHILADRALTKFLRAAGFDDVVDIYDSIEKWYS